MYIYFLFSAFLLRWSISHYKQICSVNSVQCIFFLYFAHAFFMCISLFSLDSMWFFFLLSTSLSMQCCFRPSLILHKVLHLKRDKLMSLDFRSESNVNSFSNRVNICSFSLSLSLCISLIDFDTVHAIAVDFSAHWETGEKKMSVVDLKLLWICFGYQFSFARRKVRVFGALTHRLMPNLSQWSCLNRFRHTWTLTQY